MILLFGAAALTQTIELPPAPENVGPSELEQRVTWSASTYVRPTVALYQYRAIQPIALGVAAGRRWWQLTDQLSPAFEVQGRLDWAMARGNGSHDGELAVLVGPWYRFVGLQLGPGVGHSAWVLGEQTLAPATTVDMVSTLTLDLKRVHVYGGGTPRWLVDTPRKSAKNNPVQIGDEALVRSGVGLSGRQARLGFDWSRRYNALGAIDRFSLSVRFKLL